eukprot:gene45350-30140_t
MSLYNVADVGAAQGDGVKAFSPASNGPETGAIARPIWAAGARTSCTRAPSAGVSQTREYRAPEVILGQPWSKAGGQQ